jgi:hypothetical protein
MSKFPKNNSTDFEEIFDGTPIDEPETVVKRDEMMIW